MTSVPAVDWRQAAATGRALTRPGPKVDPGEARQLVSSLRRHAVRAADYVREVTELEAPRGDSEVLVVDRRSWISANAASFEQALAGPRLALAGESEPLSGATRILAKTAGMQLGSLLAYLSAKVLGQFDPCYRPGDQRGRLLLVAPNVLSVEQQMGVDAEDFRLWVCLHEETHRVQFTHTPWLATHLSDQLARLVTLGGVSSMGAAWQGLRRRRDVTAGLSEEATVDGGSSSDLGGPSLLEIVSTPEQQHVIDQVSAVMSLLEGHADVMMDSVGTEVIPSVRRIRNRFNKRREGAGPDRYIRRWLGLDAKMRQYREGAAFARHVLDEVGNSGFNLVFTSPNTLPTLPEIHDPELWLARVGRGA